MFANKHLADFTLVTTEKYVDVFYGGKTTKERIDCYLGTLVIEFKKGWEKNDVDGAEDQLRRYVSGLLNEKKYQYTLVASDGIHFHVYRYDCPRIKKNLQKDDIELTAVTVIDAKEKTVNGSRVQEKQVLAKIREFIIRTKPTKVGSKDAPKLFESGNVLYNKCIDVLKKADKETYKVPFDEWRKYQDVVYGDFSKVSEDKQEGMFLNHTYMATVAKFLAYTMISPHGKDNNGDVILGKTFEKAGISNFIESDFFSWVLDADGAVMDYIRAEAERIDWDTVDFDMLRSIYETIEEPSSRHSLGATYTPDWLAEKTVSNLLTRSKLDMPRILDPTCGSGTFLAVAIKLLRKRTSNTEHVLESILQSVYGVDIHPVAVLFSRVNYLTTIRDLLEKRSGDIHIPVYMADTIDYPVAHESVLGGRFYTLESSGVEIHIPVDVSMSTDYIVDSVHVAAKQIARDIDKKSALAGLHTKLLRFGMSENVAQYFDSSAITLANLIKLGKDSIHAFIIKNIYRPATFSHFDIICGNPPWVVYKSIKDEKRASRLKNEVVNKLKLQTNPTVFPGMEMATLFYVKCVRDMLRPGGHIGFVMPWTILNAKQHDVFRTRNFGVDLDFLELYDMGEGHNGVRNLFTVESCVLFAKKTPKSKKGNSIPSIRMSGSLPEKSIGLTKACKFLKEKKMKIHLVDLPGGNVFTYNKKARYGKSYYRARFFQGATIVPAAAWFVRKRKSPLGSGTGKTAVETDNSLQFQAPWKIQFKGDIETEYMFKTIKAESIVPFYHTSMKTLAMPVGTEGGKYSMLRELNAFVARGHDGMAEYFKNVQKTWKENKTTKSYENVSDWLNYRNKVICQKPNKIIVLYNQSGREYMVSCIVKRTTKRFIVDNSTYYYYATSMNEASYLCVILNSRHLFVLIKPIKPARAIHRVVFDVPIPKFDPTNTLHQNLAGMYKKCEQKIKNNLSTIQKQGKKQREFSYKLLQSEMRDIDSMVKELLK